MTNFGSTDRQVFFLGEQPLSEFKKKHGSIGLVKYDRKQPKVFRDDQGNEVTLNDITFVKEVFTDENGNKQYGCTLATVSSKYDQTKPGKIQTIAYWANVDELNFDTGEIERVYKLVTNQYLCNVGATDKGELIAML